MARAKDVCRKDSKEFVLAARTRFAIGGCTARDTNAHKGERRVRVPPRPRRCRAAALKMVQKKVWDSTFLLNKSHNNDRGGLQQHRPSQRMLKTQRQETAAQRRVAAGELQQALLQ